MDILGGGLNVLALKDALLKIANNPASFKANLKALAEAQTKFEAKAAELRKREDAVAEREQAAASLDKRDAEIKLKLANLSDYAEKLDLERSEVDAAKATHAAELAKSLKALDDRRLDTVNAQQAANAKLAEHDKRFRELAGDAIRIDAQRAAVEAREAAVQEAEAAIAAKRERLAKAIQSA